MARGVSAGMLFIAACLAAYVLLKLGEFITTGLGPNSLTINAFLFLMGLGGALTLLSPTFDSRRVR
jgi:hypothetical protein